MKVLLKTCEIDSCYDKRQRISYHVVRVSSHVCILNNKLRIESVTDKQVTIENGKDFMVKVHNMSTNRNFGSFSA